MPLNPNDNPFNQALNELVRNLERDADRAREMEVNPNPPQLEPRPVRPEDQQEDDFDPVEDMRQFHRNQVELIREQRDQGERVQATRKSSASVMLSYAEGRGMIRVKLGGGGGGQVFHKEDLAQFAYWLMNEAQNQALLDRADNGEF
jgi:hypothetical protein